MASSNKGSYSLASAGSSKMALVNAADAMDADSPSASCMLMDEFSVHKEVPDVEMAGMKKKLEFSANKGDNDSTSSSSLDSSELQRNAWGSKTEYVLSMVGYCVGLGNVWRFPYVCMRNGGGAFLIPFFVCLTLCGLPLYFLETALGQFVSLSPIHVWNICPLFKGIGIAMAVVSFLFAWYYSMVLSWSLIYLVNSVKSVQPWSVCGNYWNTPNCVPTEGRIVTNASAAALATANATSAAAAVLTTVAPGAGMAASNLTYGAASVVVETLAQNASTMVGNASVSSTEEFWIHHVLQLSPGMHDMGTIQWAPGLALLAQAVIVYLCLIKGIQTVGKVVYVTATLPYILLTVFLIKGLTLPGAWDGITFYLTPDWNKVLEVQTWVEASLQVFYSLGPAWGALITMASYNRFDNNCLRDSVILSFTCEGTSVYAGFAIFGILGHIAMRMGVDVSTFTQTGPGLAFVVYPDAISLLPLPQLWGVLFFVMLFTLGLDTQFASCETILTCLSDSFPRLMNRKQYLIKLTYFVALFLLALPFTTKGGYYLFTLVDWYFSAYVVILNGLFELIVIGWIYGAENFFDDIKLMLGKRPPYIFAILWRFVTPALLLAIFFFTMIGYKSPAPIMDFEYGPTEVMIGWCIASVSFLPYPIYFVWKLWNTPGSTLFERIKESCRPNSHWQPSHPKLREQYEETNNYDRHLCHFPNPCSSSSSRRESV